MSWQHAVGVVHFGTLLRGGFRVGAGGEALGQRREESAFGVQPAGEARCRAEVRSQGSHGVPGAGGAMLIQLNSSACTVSE